MQAKTVIEPWTSPFLFFGLAFILMASKSPDSLTNAQFWAEDGSVFFQQQFGSHLPRIGTAYAGYLHVLPRLIAWLASFFSHGKAPLIYNLFACFITSWSMCYTALRLRPFLPMVLTLAIFLLAPINGEIFGTLTNVQWFTQFALVALCMPVGDGYREARNEIFVSVLVVLIGLTGPAAIFLTMINLGILGGAWILARVRPSWPLSMGLRQYVARLPSLRIILIALCALIQLLFVVTNSPAATNEITGIAQYGIPKLIGVMLGHIIPVHVFGFHFIPPVLWLLIELALVLTIVRSVRLPFEAKISIMQLLAFSLLVAFSAAALKDTRAMLQFATSDRYFYTLKFVFWWMTYLALASRTLGRQTDSLALVLCTIIYVALINGAPLQRKNLQDLEWKKHATELKAQGPHYLPINPSPWAVKVITRPAVDNSATAQ
ncbi:hypothetical protein [Dyella sp. AtDHG13]|uniref:hypothetical protein n=1 Tax=Dyella sp. AtDHG13 TaxID=1938897 RepID=UPI001F3FCD84|nr:hypothetical protein [Dyella sp. AtDHG13]